MNGYRILLYLTMALSQIAVLLQNSTLTKEAYLHCYAGLLNEILTVGPQPALGYETTKNTIKGYSLKEPNARDKDQMLLEAGQADLLKYNFAIADKISIFLGRPVEAKPFMKDFENFTLLMSDPKKIQWFAAIINLGCRK